MYDNPAMNAGKVLRVGDELETRWGLLEVEEITVCPMPTTDPAGEECGVSVQAVELAAVPAVLTLSDGHWIYGADATARKVEGEDRLDAAEGEGRR